jgi:hypothetical protein
MPVLTGGDMAKSRTPVSVISNISYADTFLAVKIAEAFAEQGKSPASK